MPAFVMMIGIVMMIRLILSVTFDDQSNPISGI